MKPEEFKKELRTALENICASKQWKFDNSKQRGMAFEDWCFNLFCERYPAAENKTDECVIRGDDAGIDIFFESKETEEIYILQCKHPKIASSDPIPEDEVKAFFSNYELLRDKHYFDARQTKNPKVEELAEEFAYWAQKGFLIHFIYISTGISTPKIQALVDKFSGDNQASNVEFEVWDIKELKDEYVSIKSIEEKYPEEWTITLAQGHYMLPDGELQNISFVVPGTVLQQLARDHKDSLFNWNIRRFLGRKGEVNAGLRQTLQDEPQHFFYYNNGISCLCETFSFEPRTRKLRVKKLQVVNGAQTVGAIKHADSHNVERALVLVKLTAVKHAHRETGLAASLIKTNNTQNTLRVPDFRSNDKIQIWLEQQFKNTKPKGEMLQIVYGRKRPYPRSSSSQSVIKLQDLGKIRYAWYHDPRIPIAEPARLFQLPEENGLYGYSFGSDGELVDIWSDEQFRESMLAIHAYNKIQEKLLALQTSQEDLKQITRLRYYGLRLFKRYMDQMLPLEKDVSFNELCGFGGKFNVFFDRAQRIICRTLAQSYREFLAREMGTAFALPRDVKVWELVRSKFEDNLALIQELKEAG